jgi:hypothetical protein
MVHYHAYYVANSGHNRADVYGARPPRPNVGARPARVMSLGGRDLSLYRVISHDRRRRRRLPSRRIWRQDGPCLEAGQQSYHRVAGFYLGTGVQGTCISEV